jgi:hypothetical protein
MSVKHDSGKQRWDFLPFDALNEVVKVYTGGHEVIGMIIYFSGHELGGAE